MDDLGFEYTTRKSGEVVISRRGVSVTTIRGKAAAEFLTDVSRGARRAARLETVPRDRCPSRAGPRFPAKRDRCAAQRPLHVALEVEPAERFRGTAGPRDRHRVFRRNAIVVPRNERANCPAAGPRDLAGQKTVERRPVEPIVAPRNDYVTEKFIPTLRRERSPIAPSSNSPSFHAGITIIKPEFVTTWE